MNSAIEAGIAEFTDQHFCRKYSGGQYESRFNRAVFDVLVGSLSHDTVRSWAKKNTGAMKALYENTCNSSPAFINAVETTTKSTDSTRNRFEIWYKNLAEASGIKLQIPDIR